MHISYNIKLWIMNGKVCKLLLRVGSFLPPIFSSSLSINFLLVNLCSAFYFLHFFYIIWLHIISDCRRCRWHGCCCCLVVFVFAVWLASSFYMYWCSLYFDVFQPLPYFLVALLFFITFQPHLLVVFMIYLLLFCFVNKLLLLLLLFRALLCLSFPFTPL